ncbi:predicted protein [Nematostella vectensis]|uniref:Uncharacterized protein n=1 Tax=Nematostella vectensis TaxID=45351 RepID=A7SWJ6_NEMVE|nr:predicted protein [Nematostella vectensis]|eukprot:XP_001624020.1 predicted protein [Nematostella vectensis]
MNPRADPPCLTLTGGCQSKLDADRIKPRKKPRDPPTPRGKVSRSTKNLLSWPKPKKTCLMVFRRIHVCVAMVNMLFITVTNLKEKHQVNILMCPMNSNFALTVKREVTKAMSVNQKVDVKSKNVVDCTTPSYTGLSLPSENAINRARTLMYHLPIMKQVLTHMSAQQMRDVIDYLKLEGETKKLTISKIENRGTTQISKLVDIQETSTVEIGLLIGVNFFEAMLQHEGRKGLKGHLYAVRTDFGCCRCSERVGAIRRWSATCRPCQCRGRCPALPDGTLVENRIGTKFNKAENISFEDERALDDLRHNTKFRSDQTFPDLLWKEKDVRLPSNKPLAERRLEQTERAIDKNDASCFLTTQAVLRDFYMDDLVKSVPTKDEAIQIAKQLINLLSRGGFHLTKFMSNSEVLDALPSHEIAQAWRILGRKSSRSSLESDTLEIKGQINAALRFVSETSSGGVLGLTDDVMTQLKEKHSDPQPAKLGSLLFGPIDDAIPDTLYSEINSDMVRQAALRTKGSGGPSGIDANGFRRMLASKCFSHLQDCVMR